MKVLFFCGHQSRLGMASISPLLKSKLRPSKIIIATPERWNYFGKVLKGEIYYREKNNYKFNIKSIAKTIMPPNIINFLTKHKSTVPYRKLKKFTKSANIPVDEYFNINSPKTLADLESQEYDLFVSAAYPQIFGKKILEIPKLGTINIHPSILPSYRGAHPHYWAIASGEKYGGITAHFMTGIIDDGEIIAQIKISIDNCNYSYYYEKIEKLLPFLIQKIENYFCSNKKNLNVEEDTQTPNIESYFKNDRTIHHRIFWNLHNSEQVFNLCRAGKAFFFLKGEKVILTKCYISNNNRNMTNNVQVEQGTVVDFLCDSIVVKTRDRFINIQEIEYRGEQIGWKKWADKCRIRVGMKME